MLFVGPPKPTETQGSTRRNFCNRPLHQALDQDVGSLRFCSTLPYYTIPYYNVPYYNIRYDTILYSTLLYHTIIQYTIKYHTIPECEILALLWCFRPFYLTILQNSQRRAWGGAAPCGAGEGCGSQHLRHRVHEAPCIDIHTYLYIYEYTWIYRVITYVHRDYGYVYRDTCVCICVYIYMYMYTYA